jgi:hypothetical protein
MGLICMQNIAIKSKRKCIEMNFYPTSSLPLFQTFINSGVYIPINNNYTSTVHAWKSGREEVG